MKQLLIIFIMLVLAFGLDYRKADFETLQGDSITVTIEGQVEEPGPVTVHPYTTVAELLEQTALLEDADTSTLNPDTVLNDHDILRIPKQKEETELPRVSINTADAQQLSQLPGIGPAMAERIILFRDENGLFQKTDDLMKVKGIGARKYEAIADLITL